MVVYALDNSKDCNLFALQIDESTDIADMAQLMVFIRFDCNDEIIEEFLQPLMDIWLK